MGEEISIINSPEIKEREIPGEGKYIELNWELNEVPTENWLKKFDKVVKPWIENTDTRIGPYKPKIFFNELVSTIKSKEELEIHKKFLIEEIIEKINKI